MKSIQRKNCEGDAAAWKQKSTNHVGPLINDKNVIKRLKNHLIAKI